MSFLLVRVLRYCGLFVLCLTMCDGGIGGHDGGDRGGLGAGRVSTGKVREIIGAVDKIILEQMMLVFQDVPTGYIVQEEVSDAP